MQDLTLYKEARKKTKIWHDLLSIPFIYGMFFPVLILDICVEIYHNVAFRLYHIPLLDRSEYILFDRQLMEQLTPMQKFNCIYCSYANGLLRFAADVAGETERYWCPLKYKENVELELEHQPHHKDFLEEE